MLRKISGNHYIIRRTIRRAGIAALAAAISICLAACGGASAEPVSQEGFFLDTVCSVSIYRMKDDAGEVKPASELKEEANAVISDAFALCRDLEDKLSRTRKDSDVSRINSAKGEWTGVSDDTIDVISKGLEYSELSGGDFDITIGGVTKLWDFHADADDAKLPDEKKLAEAVRHVDHRKVVIDGNRVRLEDPETEIDLGGIAKGYIGDRMTELLEQRGVVSATINLGGNVICIGGKTDEDDFVVGVETPFSDRTEITGKINARDKTLVTSGVYERRIEVDGRTYHHILDTKTGWPAETDLDAVTLIGGKGRSADMDALSTTCLIKGSEEGKKLIDATEGVEAVFVLSDGSIITTDAAAFEKN